MNIINRKTFDLSEGEILVYQECGHIPQVPNDMRDWDLDRLYSVLLRNQTSGGLEQINFRLISGINFYSKNGFHYIWGETTVHDCYIIFKFKRRSETREIDTIVVVRCSEFKKLDSPNRIGLFGRITTSAINT